jgi:hypothetical protein
MVHGRILKRPSQFIINVVIPTSTPHTEQVGVAVTLQTCTGEMLGSNLGQDIGYLDLSILWFYSVPTDKCRNSI